MPELLLELFSEEIPARMQARAADDLKRLMAERLAEARLDYEAMRSYATPRRLALVVDGLPERQPDLAEERRGPRADAPEKAIAGFKGSLPPDAKIEEREEKKGTFLYAVIDREGRLTEEILRERIPLLVHQFPWPKSIRSGEASFRWVRPLHNILVKYAGKFIPVELGVFDIYEDIKSGDLEVFPVTAEVKSQDKTWGHRFLSADPIKAADFVDYEKKLRSAHVLLDPAERRERIAAGAAKLAADEGLEVIADPALLAENAGLTEWPVPLLGRFDEAFLEVPPEVLMTSMKTHQRFFSLRDPATGRLAPRFICVANLEAADGGEAIVAGNEKVLAARLADARFFWGQDRKLPLEARLADLREIVFHEKLGTLAERVDRIEELAAHLAQTAVPLRAADRSYFDKLSTNGPAWLAEAHSAQSVRPEPVEGRTPAQQAYVACVRRAARLCKADLTTEMVGEFPELQGLMGRYYALEQGEPEPIAHAVEAHYAPRGPDDACPSDPVSVCVALAEKLDTLVGFFAIGQKPTGSKDPFALRRAALGIIRLIVENRLRLELHGVTAVGAVPFIKRKLEARAKKQELEVAVSALSNVEGLQALGNVIEEFEHIGAEISPEFFDLLDFFADRLKVQQREKGVRHDYIEAVFSLGGEDDLVRLLDRVAALQDFLATDDGANLLAGYKRANNILKIEEKKDAASYGDKDVEPKRLAEPAEITLYEKLGAAQGEAERALELEDFADAMRALASLRVPIDAFFDHVTVNAEDADLRDNRLALLGRIRAAVDTVADFSKIEG